MTAINFPSSPANGDTQVVGAITYVYSTAKGAWEKPVAVAADLLLVGGGGGGAYKNGGGGAAGGFLPITSAQLGSGTTYNIVIGAGGSGSQGGNTVPGGQGSLTSFGTLYFAGPGGGGASADEHVGGTGASTGGSFKIGTDVPATAPPHEYMGTTQQGNRGGVGAASSSTAGCGGGGGASAVGGDGQSSGSTAVGGNGGAGQISSITGVSVTYAGGGGAANGTVVFDFGTTIASGLGGAGGGGNSGQRIRDSGGNAVDSYAENGTNGLGGGGGSGPGNWTGSTAGNAGGYFGGDGGDGVCIVRSLTSLNPTTTGSPTITTDGDYSVYIFTVNGTITY